MQQDSSLKCYISYVNRDAVKGEAKRELMLKIQYNIWNISIHRKLRLERGIRVPNIYSEWDSRYREPQGRKCKFIWELKTTVVDMISQKKTINQRFSVRTNIFSTIWNSTRCLARKETELWQTINVSVC